MTNRRPEAASPSLAFAALAVLCFAWACGAEPEDAPVAAEPDPVAETAAEEDGGAEAPFVEHTLARGETVSAVAQHGCVDVAEDNLPLVANAPGELHCYVSGPASQVQNPVSVEGALR